MKVALTLPRPILYERIERRFRESIMARLPDEVRRLRVGPGPARSISIAVYRRENAAQRLPVHHALTLPASRPYGFRQGEVAGFQMQRRRCVPLMHETAPSRAGPGLPHLLLHGLRNRRS